MSAQPENTSGHPAREHAAVSSGESCASGGTGEAPPGEPRRSLLSYHFVRLWLNLSRWVQHHTFAPPWLAGRWRRPFVGYLAAFLLAWAAVTGDLLMLWLFPAFGAPGLLNVLVVLLVALTWGVGPSLVATLTGVLLWDFCDIPPRFTLAKHGTALVADDLFYILVGVVISLIALQVQRARRNAEALATSLTVERARSDEVRAEADARASQLEAIFKALADGLVAFDARGCIVRINPTARRLLEEGGVDIDFTQLSPVEWRDLLVMRDTQGQVIPEDGLPVRRALRGESVTGDYSREMILRRADGLDVMMNVSSTPVRDADGQIVGAVSVFHDVTERHRLERRTHEALNGLLAIAQTLVQTPDELSFAEQQGGVASAVARRLAELTAQVLGCERLGIFSFNPETGTLHAVAVVGLPAEIEEFAQPWRFEGLSFGADDAPRAEFFARLLEGKPLVWDMSQPPLSDQPNPLGIREILAVPMRLREQLIGALLLDHGVAAHTYTPGELSLAEGSAMLAALVLERERLLREREEARANALAMREAKRQMDEFLEVASHELRTPLTTVLLDLQYSQRRYHKLLEETVSPEELAEQLEFLLDQQVRTERQAKRLNRLVNDLLDVSRIQTDKLAMRPQLTDLATIVAKAVEEERQIAPERVIDLHLPSTRPPPLFIDPDRIGQVVTNYLTNAIKYSPEEEPIQVGLEMKSDAARVWVRDQGPGLYAGQQALAWTRFHRVPGVKVQSGSGVGLGLGLHISRMIIEAHQGQVGIESAPDAGATFWFTLPLPSS